MRSGSGVEVKELSKERRLTLKLSSIKLNLGPTSKFMSSRLQPEQVSLS